MSDPIRSYDDALAQLQKLRDGREAPLTAHARRTRQRILDAARDAFAAHGYRRASTAAIAEAAATAKATVYAHFPSKAELLLAVLVEERVRLYEQMQPLLGAPQPPAVRLRRILAQAVTLMPTMPITNRVKAGEPDMVAALRELEPARIAAVYGLFQRIFVWLIREAAEGELPEPELQARAHAVILILQALPLIASPQRLGPVPVEAFARTFASVVADGARAPLMPWERHESQEDDET